jgi:ABC-type Mn2+/Zn2+ transport system ATPase subunit
LTEVVVRVRDLSVSYVRGSYAVKGVSFEVHRGELLYVLGPNGAGKSTILKALIGAVKPSSGTIELFGTPIERFREWWRIGYVPQNAQAQLSRTPVSVEEVLRASRIPGRAMEAEEVLRLVGFAEPVEVLRKPLFQLSGGQFQRVLLAMALINAPELLLLDEPTAYIDVTGVSEFIRLVNELNREMGTTVITVTHDVSAITAHRSSMVLCVNRDRSFFGTIGELVASEELCNVYGFHVLTLGHVPGSGEK